MRKQFLFLLGVLVLSVTVQAQSSKSKPKATQTKAKPVAKKTGSAKQYAAIKTTGWPEDERTVFFDACIKELNWSKDSATRYCNCMLAKIEKIYPTAAESENLTQEKAVELAKECLAAETKSSGWGAKERNEFTTECETAAAKNIGAEKAKTYCACMLVKVEREFPNPADISKMKQESVMKWAEECNKQ